MRPSTCAHTYTNATEAKPSLQIVQRSYSEFTVVKRSQRHRFPGRIHREFQIVTRHNSYPSTCFVPRISLTAHSTSHEKKKLKEFRNRLSYVSLQKKTFNTGLSCTNVTFVDGTSPRVAYDTRRALREPRDAEIVSPPQVRLCEHVTAAATRQLS